jgi:hypothetical protein
MKEEEIRKKELKARLSMVYSQGLKQPRLFSIKEGKENEEAIKFRELINSEAQKRNLKPLELIEYFAENREELIILLEENTPEIKVDISRIPGDIRDFTNKFLISRLSKKDYIGIEETEEYGEMEKWVSNDIGYLVKKINYLEDLFGKPPKVHVSQDKNIKLLIALIEQKQFNRIDKKAKVSFTLKEYAKYRGFTEEELASDGRIYQELRRDLLSGARTVYSIPIKRNSKGYRLIGTLYQIEVPDERGGKWTVWFSGRYAESIEKILNGKGKRYFTHYLKEIADRTTNREIHLHEFYNQLVFRRRKSGTTMPAKIITILRAMKLPDKILKRPKECYGVLKNCLVYFSDNYPEELNSITIYNNFNKNETIKLQLGLTEAFNSYGYEDFRDLILRAIKVKDFREALISFRGKPIKKRDKKFDLNKIGPEETKLIERVIKWAYSNWNIKKDKSEVINYLKRFIIIKGYDFLKSVFEKEANKEYPNAIEFLFKVLPGILKEKNEGATPENKEIINNISNSLFK